MRAVQGTGAEQPRARLVGRGSGWPGPCHWVGCNAKPWPTLTLSWTMGIQPSVGFKVPHSVPPPPPPTPTQHTHCHAGQLLASLYCQMGRAEEAMAVLRASMALWFKPAKSEDNEERWVCRRHLCSRSHSAQGPAG